MTSRPPLLGLLWFVPIVALGGTETVPVDGGISFDCSSLPGNGNCSAASAVCGCDPFAPGGVCYPTCPDGGVVIPDEVCDNEIDDDRDTDVDCEDPDCLAAAEILALADGNTADRLQHVDADIQFNVVFNGSCALPLEFEWDFGDGVRTPALSPVHAYDEPGFYDVTLTTTCTDPEVCPFVIEVDRLFVTAFSVTLQSFPETMGTDEIVLSGQDGEGFLVGSAVIEPAAAEAEVAPMLRWSLPGELFGTAVSFSPSTGGSTVSATLTGYPTSNAAFGPRELKLQVVDDTFVVAETSAPFELFFARDDRDASGTPNWFRYWKDALDSAGLLPTGVDVRYGGAFAGAQAQTPAMTQWSYGTLPFPKDVVLMHDGVQIDGEGAGPPPLNAEITLLGLDNFYSVLLHEAKHVEQIALADAHLRSLVGTTASPLPGLPGTPAAPWRNGWSWGMGTNDNHWTVGRDGKPGRARVDDNGDLAVDNLPAAKGELGNGDDVRLSTDPLDPDWPSAWPVPRSDDITCRIGRTTSHIETEACRRELRDATGTLFRELDWASPGFHSAP